MEVFFIIDQDLLHNFIMERYLKILTPDSFKVATFCWCYISTFFETFSPPTATSLIAQVIIIFFLGHDVVIIKNGLRVCGNGGALCSAPLVQSKSYFEVKIQQEGKVGYVIYALMTLKLQLHRTGSSGFLIALLCMAQRVFHSSSGPSRCPQKGAIWSGYVSSW